MSTAHSSASFHHSTSTTMSSCSSPSSQKPVSLLDLSPDLLRVTADFLRPRDRLNLALANRRLYREIWGNFAKDDLLLRFPIERRLEFSLNVLLDNNLQPTTHCSTSHLRMVPNRGKQQHINVAVTSDASLVAILPYDNRLRIMDMQKRTLQTEIDVSPLFDYDVWDTNKCIRRAVARSNAHVYADESGLDIDISLQFSTDDSILMLSSRNKVRLYEVLEHGRELRLQKEISCEHFLSHTLSNMGYLQGIAGAATLSPDGTSVAWIMFAGNPATVFVTFWDVRNPTNVRVAEVTKIYPRRFLALGWARMAFTPNGKYCLLVCNAAKKMQRTERINGEFVRRKFCRFHFALFDTSKPVHLMDMEPVRERHDWLQLASSVYSNDLSRSISVLLDGLSVHSPEHEYNRGKVLLSKRAQLRQHGLVFNSLHSCPAEATYKALMFGTERVHSWFITKQPMYSMHFSMDGSRVQVAPSPHANLLQTLVRGEDANENLTYRNRQIQSDDVGNRRMHVFRGIPWRTSFATVTAFSSTGKWLVGASLHDQDICNVCLRNITVNEYFG